MTYPVCLDNQLVPSKTPPLNDVDLDAFDLHLDDNFQDVFIKEQSDVRSRVEYSDDSYFYSDESIWTSLYVNLFPENTSKADHISVSESNFLSFDIINVSGHISGVRIIFEIQEETNELKHHVVQHRVNLLQSPNIAAYIECPVFLVYSQDRDGHGALIAFSLGDYVWYLIFISSHVIANHLLPSHHTHESYILIFYWKGCSTTIKILSLQPSTSC